MSSIDGVLARLALNGRLLHQYADERLPGLLLSLDPRIRRGKSMKVQPRVRLCEDDKKRMMMKEKQDDQLKESSNPKIM